MDKAKSNIWFSIDYMFMKKSKTLNNNIKNHKY